MRGDAYDHLLASRAPPCAERKSRQAQQVNVAAKSKPETTLKFRP